MGGRDLHRREHHDDSFMGKESVTRRGTLGCRADQEGEQGGARVQAVMGGCGGSREKRGRRDREIKERRELRLEFGSDFEKKRGPLCKKRVIWCFQSP